MKLYRPRNLGRLSLPLLVIFLFLSGSCARNIAPPTDVLEMPEELRVAVEARVATLESARFRDVVLEYYGEGERVRVRQLILVEQPASLRVQTRLPGSDEILNLLVSDGTTFAMHQRDSHEYYTGVPSRENINHLLPLDLSGRDVVRIMLGGAPWDRFDIGSSAPSLEWDKKRGLYRYFVTRQESGDELSMYVRHTDYAVVEVREVAPDGELIYAYTTEGWRRNGTVSLPVYRRFIWPKRDLDFSLDVGDTQLNIHLEAHLFELPPPPGSRIIELDN